VKFTTRAQLSGRDLAGFKSKLRELKGVRVGGKAQAPTAVAEAGKKPDLA
jgi:hypothetical protein